MRLHEFAVNMYPYNEATGEHDSEPVIKIGTFDMDAVTAVYVDSRDRINVCINGGEFIVRNVTYEQVCDIWAGKTPAENATVATTGLARVLTCPICGGSNITNSHSFDIENTQTCADCGYKFPFYK